MGHPPSLGWLAHLVTAHCRKAQAALCSHPACQPTLSPVHHPVHQRGHLPCAGIETCTASCSHGIPSPTALLSTPCTAHALKGCLLRAGMGTCAGSYSRGVPSAIWPYAPIHALRASASCRAGDPHCLVQPLQSLLALPALCTDLCITQPLPHVESET